jgi:GH15 family glucan-1,4-alpha-glucosidase
MHTTALVGLNGSIDWFCYPRHDSPSIFAALLDSEKGGHFRITPAVEEIKHKQFYWPQTNVLVTRFLSSCGIGEIVDFMPEVPLLLLTESSLSGKFKIIASAS